MEDAFVRAIIILDGDGARISAKYFGAALPSLKEQKDFEARLFAKTRRVAPRHEADVLLHDGAICVFRTGDDALLYVVGAGDENELILASVLEALYDSLAVLLKEQVERSVLLDNLELVVLVMDELCDGGVVLETDSMNITNRVLMRGPDGDAPLSELTFSQALASAREQFTRSFLK
eukprot:PLAT13481.1.p1 GENE.PLAT13481.1~~PLAT13481.1.p1  ORF type:complete len:207 (-),score=93.77 PLAT13481.1:154-684(-)